ncbi:MAG: putative Fe-S cluster assembly protein SufT, partial [Burkholderiales bacterium]
MRDIREQLTLTRDVEAALVPVGDRITLKAGERATVTQALGGSYTVVVGGNMYRIDGKDSDALGKAPAALQEATPAEEPAAREQVEEAVWEQLRTCYDPEIPVSIVDLGLVYECTVAPLGDEGGGWSVQVRMTLTAPGCGMGDYLAREVEQKLSGIPGVKQAGVELVWDPPWSREMMS